METLESLLNHPALAGADQLMLQAGKPVIFIKGTNPPQGAGTPLAAADVERLLSSVLSPQVQTALASQPSVAFNSQLPIIGACQVQIAKDGAGFRAIFKRVAAAPAATSGPPSAPAVAATVPAKAAAAR